MSKVHANRLTFPPVMGTCAQTTLSCQHVQAQRILQKHKVLSRSTGGYVGGRGSCKPLDACPGVFKVPQHACSEEDAGLAHLVHAALHPELLQQSLAHLQCPSLGLACIMSAQRLFESPMTGCKGCSTGVDVCIDTAQSGCLVLPCM